VSPYSSQTAQNIVAAAAHMSSHAAGSRVKLDEAIENAMPSLTQSEVAIVAEIAIIAARSIQNGSVGLDPGSGKVDVEIALPILAQVNPLGDDPAGALD